MEGPRPSPAAAPTVASAFAYGGQFGDEPNDANFVADGLVSPEGLPHPAMHEVAWVYRPVDIAPVGAGGDRVRITNRRSFRDLGDLRATWELLVDGVVSAAGRLALPKVAPGASAEVSVPLPTAATPPAAERHLVVRIVTGTATPWAPAGHEVAWQQIELPRRRSGPRRRARSVPPERAGDTAVLTDGPAGWQATVDLAGARLAALTLAGEPLLAAEPRPELWRGPTDNDGLKLLPNQGHKPLARWQAWGLDRLERTAADAEVEAGAVVLRRRLTTGSGLAIDHVCRISATGGALTFDEQVDIPEAIDDLPRVGTSFLVAAGFDRVEWFGDGPHECYPDRRAAAIAARFEGEPDELPYVMPQEFGLRTGVRWAAMTNPSRRLGLLAIALDPATLAWSATHHTADDLSTARDVTELRRRDELVVHLDVAHRGLGTASCGPDTLPGLPRARWPVAMAVGAAPVHRRRRGPGRDRPHPPFSRAARAVGARMARQMPRRSRHWDG